MSHPNLNDAEAQGAARRDLAGRLRAEVGSLDWTTAWALFKEAADALEAADTELAQCVYGPHALLTQRDEELSGIERALGIGPDDSARDAIVQLVTLANPYRASGCHRVFRHAKGNYYVPRRRWRAPQALEAESIILVSLDGEDTHTLVTDAAEPGEVVVTYTRLLDRRSFTRPARLFDETWRFTPLA